MEAYILDSLQLILRYFHIVAAIAWIGASFYFVWLDNNLKTPPTWKQEKGIKGDLWAIHGGGFYEVAKYQHGPEKMPETLHWFKWEAYTTWLTGFLLFSLMYYVGAEAYLMDASKAELSKGEAIALSFWLLVVGLGFYEGLCRLKLPTLLFAVVCLLALTGYFYGLNLVFAQKAAYLQTGALIGTCMASNVFFHIMPSQRYMVAEIAAGRTPDAAPGLNAKMRSVHNNYATLPVLFLMMSGHFAFVTGRDNAWLILLTLLSLGMWIRHYFNLKHQGNRKPWVLVSGLFGVVALLLALAPWPKEVTAVKPKPMAMAAKITTVSDADGMAVIATHCQSCHSKTPSSTLFASAPLGLTLDTIQDVFTHKVSIIQRTVINKDMPLGNMSKMTDSERALVKSWLKN